MITQHIWPRMNNRFLELLRLYICWRFHLIGEFFGRLFRIDRIVIGFIGFLDLFS